MSKAKLHEVLAVIKDLNNVSAKVIAEGKVTFCKHPDRFQGHVKTLEEFGKDDGEVKDPKVMERNKLDETVAGKLDYVSKAIQKAWNAEYQRDIANTEAFADIVVEGVTIAKEIPATFLLSMETKLKDVRALLDSIPTLAPGIEWEKAEEANVYRTKFSIKTPKTQTIEEFKTIAPATEQHPAQVAKVSVTKDIGEYTTQRTSGMITPFEKSQYLGRLDKITSAIKKARQRANSVEVKKGDTGTQIMKYIMTT